MKSNKVAMKINGKETTVDLAEMLRIENISSDMDKIAAQLGYWGALWSEAEAEREAVDAYYRQWRAKQGKAITERDSKMAEWKVKQQIEANDKFHAMKKGSAVAIRNAILCKVVCDALRIKANMLQSKGAMLRHELDATGMTTKNSKPAPKDPKTTMKKIFNGRK